MNLCPLINDWKPPKSPVGLIQEDLWPNEWKILVSCLMLNLTTRKQVDSVIYKFFNRWPTPESLAAADLKEVQNMIKPLGMWRKRSTTLLRFNKEYQETNWVTAKDLHGCGKYANDAWLIFCKGVWKDVEPNDHALTKYHNFLKRRKDA